MTTERLCDALSIALPSAACTARDAERHVQRELARVARTLLTRVTLVVAGRHRVRCMDVEAYCRATEPCVYADPFTHAHLDQYRRHTVYFHRAGMASNAGWR